MSSVQDEIEHVPEQLSECKSLLAHVLEGLEQERVSSKLSEALQTLDGFYSMVKVSRPKKQYQVNC